MIHEYVAEVVIKDEKFVCESCLSFGSVAFHDLSTPHSDVFPASERSEEPFCFDEPVVLSFVDPIVKCDVLDWVVAYISSDAFLR